MTHWDMYPTTHTGAGTEQMRQSCQNEEEVTHRGRNEGHSLWPSRPWGPNPEAGACKAGVSWVLSSSGNLAKGPMESEGQRDDTLPGLPSGAAPLRGCYTEQSPENRKDFLPGSLEGPPVPTAVDC